MAEWNHAIEAGEIRSETRGLEELESKSPSLLVMGCNSCSVVNIGYVMGYGSI